MKECIEHSKLLSILDFSAESGVFTWKVRRCYRALAGSVAGTINTRGYVHILVCGRKYLAHRLAWFYVHGTWPLAQIDHINMVKTDNRISNLREATNSQNHGNVLMHPMKGIRVRQLKTTTAYEVYISDIYIGMFTLLEDAQLAYATAAKERYGAHARLF